MAELVSMTTRDREELVVDPGNAAMVAALTNALLDVRAGKTAGVAIAELTSEGRITTTWAVSSGEKFAGAALAGAVLRMSNEMVGPYDDDEGVGSA